MIHSVPSHRYRTSQYRRTLVLLAVSLYIWNDPIYPVFDGVGLAGFKRMNKII